MDVKGKNNLIIYRQRDSGLEVFVVNDSNNQSSIAMVPSHSDLANSLEEERVIALDPSDINEGLMEQAWAVEADWHEIPSIKGLLMKDAEYVKEHLSNMVPDIMEKGTFVAVKDVFKKVLPHQYKWLKELKEILVDRNSTKYM